MSKRFRFLAVSVLLSLGLFFISSPPYSELFGWALAFPAAALILTYFSLGRPEGIEVLTLTMMPFLVSLGASLNQYFYPNFSLPTKVVSWISFAAVFYITLLAMNVFRVSRMREEKIPLVKAARPAVFILSFLAAFLLLTALYKLALGVALTTAAVFGIGFLISLNLFWFFSTTDLFEREQFVGAAAVGLGLLQISLALSFFPAKPHLRGLSEAVFFYAILGVARAYFEKHLKYAIVLEYILLSLAVFLFVRFF